MRFGGRVVVRGSSLRTLTRNVTYVTARLDEEGDPDGILDTVIRQVRFFYYGYRSPAAVGRH
jgi:hypothetical protein